MDATETDTQARAVERDIERTRNEMDATLSKLERRLAPSEIVHQGTESVRETVRERVRGIGTNTLDALKRHPVPVALVVGLVLTRYAYRPSAQERLQLQAAEDFDRTWRVVRAGLTRAKDQSLDSEAKLERWALALASDAGRWAEPKWQAAERLARRGGQDAWRVLQQAVESSRSASRTMRDASAARPLAAMALVGLVAALGLRRRRSTH